MKKNQETLEMKVLNNFSKRLPGVWLACMTELHQYKAKGYVWDEEKSPMPMELAVYSAMTNKYSLKAYEKDEDIPNKIMGLFAWRKQKEVYQVNSSIFEKFALQERTENKESLSLLSFSESIFFDLTECDFEGIEGCFCCIDHDRVDQGVEEREYHMYFLFVKNGNLVDACGFPLREGLTISSAIEEGLELVKKEVDKEDAGWEEVESETDIKNKAKAENLKKVIGIIDGLINNDIKVVEIEDENTSKRITDVTETTIQPVPRRWNME